MHDPEPKVRRAYDYPDPIVDHREAIAEYKARSHVVNAVAREAAGQPSAMVATNCWSWRRLRHSNTPSQYLPYSETIESPVSQ